MLSGCSASGPGTFAGFTFGGGGNTFSAEPAVCIIDKESSKLVAGSPSGKVYLDLEWAGSGTAFQGESITLSSAQVMVEAKSESVNLKDGSIVLQARQEDICHGSFDFTTLSKDGREFSVVGSFTARIEQKK